MNPKAKRKANRLEIYKLMLDAATLEQTIRENLKDTTVVPYPTEELTELQRVIKYDGVLDLIYRTVKVSQPTVKKIAKDGLGRNIKVKTLREFVKGYLSAVA